MKRIAGGFLTIVLMLTLTSAAGAHEQKRKYHSYGARSERGIRDYETIYAARRGKHSGYQRGVARDCCELAARLYARETHRRYAARRHARARYAYVIPRAVYYVAYVPLSRYPQYVAPPPAREYDADELLLGTAIWWDQMLREGRNGGGF
jgi:hypothetical protein